MYVLDTNIFYSFAHYYFSRFPTLWEKVDVLVKNGKLCSVKEVYMELDQNCPSDAIKDWVDKRKRIFKTPSEEELQVVAEIFKNRQYQNLVKRNNLLRGFPVADPFIVAFAVVQEAIVVTQEAEKGGARIPTVCKDFKVRCINLEEFLKQNKIKF